MSNGIDLTHARHSVRSVIGESFSDTFGHMLSSKTKMKGKFRDLQWLFALGKIYCVWWWRTHRFGLGKPSVDP